jgi:hypothetical protein
MKNTLLAMLSYIAFGLGSLPDGSSPTEGGMLFISIFDHEPKVERRIQSNGVYLFSVEF